MEGFDADAAIFGKRCHLPPNAGRHEKAFNADSAFFGARARRPPNAGRQERAFTEPVWRFRWSCWGALALLLCGCDAAKTPTVAIAPGEVQQQLNNAVEAVKQTAQLAGAIALQLNGKPVNASGCYGQFAPLAGRQSVVHLTSYNTPSNEQFPSMLFAAQVAPTTATGLAGQIVSAQAFIQPAADGPLWQSIPGKPVQIRFTTADEQNFAAEVVSGTLMNVVTGETFSLTGKFNGAWLAGS